MQCSQRGRLPAERHVHQSKYVGMLHLPCVTESIVSVTQDKVEVNFFTQSIHYLIKIKCDYTINTSSLE